MLRLGVIGTGWISYSFVEAAIQTNKYKLTSVYSTSSENGIKFTKNFNTTKYTSNINEFSNDNELDVVYIASPNALHYEHAVTLIKAGKHIIVEKPAFSNINELKKILELAQEYNVLVLEAARHIHNNNFQLLKTEVSKLPNIIGATFCYMKYSARYDLVLEGKTTPNIFSPKYSGGALLDLGIYLVYAAIDLFGVPNDSYYYAKLISTKVDGMGTVIFRYNNFDVTMHVGKLTNSSITSEIYTEKTTLSIPNIDYIKSIKRLEVNKEPVELVKEFHEHNMYEEADIFADIINNIQDPKYKKHYEKLTQLAINVHQILTELRKQNNIIFDADSKTV